MGITYTYPVNRAAANTLLGKVPNSFDVTLVTKNVSGLRDKWSKSSNGLSDSCLKVLESVFIGPPIEAEVVSSKKKSGIPNNINILGLV